ncbi:PH domain-like protein [Dissoconium aciculare CBS 342.82]|uniref:PH domain-like protein n=1 Tax=Dissoconium aciculare CBS 342.82 TaxID=1314786 RepID=A0A6J3M795_9PEZI|nr:PH domain-like protein [Dissoconium aciculare CBS 342.82]KAF1822727.1 PH domain-like protein [Dissoconium aciculare CBS 342.82]
MPSHNRKVSRQVHLQSAPPGQSDYDTDTANLTDNQYHVDMAVHAQPQRSAEELNMLVLRRWYPEVEYILAIAPFATLYTFAPDSQQWNKCETEGVLFVVQLEAQAGYPRYRLIILNRKSMVNFELDLVSMDNIEITTEYVIVQVPDEEGTPQIFGIWIFSDKSQVPDMREVIAATIVDCANRAEEHTQHAAELDGYPIYDSSEGAYQQSGNHQQQVQHQQMPQQPQPQHSQSQFGQQIDLSRLFTKPQAPVEMEAQRFLDTQTPTQSGPNMHAYNSSALPHAHPASHDPNQGGAMWQPQQPMSSQFENPPQAHNLLLDLFKNASKLS